MKKMRGKKDTPPCPALLLSSLNYFRPAQVVYCNFVRFISVSSSVDQLCLPGIYSPNSVYMGMNKASPTLFPQGERAVWTGVTVTWSGWIWHQTSSLPTQYLMQ